MVNLIFKKYVKLYYKRADNSNLEIFF